MTGQSCHPHPALTLNRDTWHLPRASIHLILLKYYTNMVPYNATHDESSWKMVGVIFDMWMIQTTNIYIKKSHCIIFSWNELLMLGYPFLCSQDLSHNWLHFHGMNYKVCVVGKNCMDVLLQHIFESFKRNHLSCLFLRWFSSSHNVKLFSYFNNQLSSRHVWTMFAWVCLNVDKK